MQEETEFFETKAIHPARNGSDDDHVSPVFLSSGFPFHDSGEMEAAFNGESNHPVYSRLSNPNTSELAHKMAVLEGAEAGACFASGMAAIFSTLMAFLKSGDEIVSYHAVFGTTFNLLKETLSRFGISCRFAEKNEQQFWQEAISSKTRIVYIETPTNPGLEIIDIAMVTALAKAQGAIVVVDNTFATPYLQQPIQSGADLSIHSATKYIDGQGRILGGIVVGRKELLQQIKTFSILTGPVMSPFHAWMLNRSLETLALRMDRHCSNAMELAGRLENHPRIEKVIYPFLNSHEAYPLAKRQMKSGGGMVTIILKDDENGAIAKRFLDHLKLISIVASLGDSRTIAIQPYTTTHKKLSASQLSDSGIVPGMVRISVGLEHWEDIMKDIKQALER